MPPDAQRKYKTLSYAEKIACLISEKDLLQIEKDFNEMQRVPPEVEAKGTDEVAKYQQSRLRPYLFNKPLQRIVSILRHNYKRDFNRVQIMKVTESHTRLQQPLGFSSL